MAKHSIGYSQGRLMYLPSLIILLLLAGCSGRQTKKIPEQLSVHDSLIHIDSFYIDQTEVNSNEYKEFKIRSVWDTNGIKN